MDFRGVAGLFASNIAMPVFCGLFKSMKEGCKQGLARNSMQRLCLALLLSLVAVLTNAAEDAPVYLLLSGDQPYYQEVSAVFQQVLAQRAKSPQVLIRDLKQTTEVVPGSTVVAVGSKASEFALSHFSDADILSLLIPVATWDELLARLSGTGRRAAVVIDQPVERPLAMAKLLVPEAQRVGAVFGPVSVASKPQLLRAVERASMELVYAHLDSDDNPIGVLSPLVQKTDVFLAVADRGVFNKSVAKWLLYLSFRQKVAIIGFSRSYAKAGALAAVYSSPENIGRHGAELLARLLNLKGEGSMDGEAWQTHDPQYYTLEVNRAVAAALNISVPDQQSLYRDYQAVLESSQ